MSAAAVIFVKKAPAGTNLQVWDDQAQYLIKEDTEANIKTFLTDLGVSDGDADQAIGRAKELNGIRVNLRSSEGIGAYPSGRY